MEPERGDGFANGEPRTLRRSAADDLRGAIHGVRTHILEPIEEHLPRLIVR